MNKQKRVIEKKPKPRKANVNTEIEKASSIAEFYGFVETPEFSIEKEDIQKSKSFRESSMKDFLPFAEQRSNFYTFVEERVSLMRNFFDRKFSHLSQPVSVFYQAPKEGNSHSHESRHRNEHCFCLDMVGNSKSIADATIIETTYIILSELYPKKELRLALNSVGDRESSNRFSRELTNYYKKNWSSLPAHCKALFKKDVFEIIRCKDESCLAFHQEAPHSINFLSEQSRKQFKEVLEYIEMLNIPYVLDHTLLGNKHIASGTVFEVVEDVPNGDGVLAFGERYNCLMKKAWGKKEVPAIGSVLRLKQGEHTEKDSIQAKKPSKNSKFSFYFIQLSFDAKLKSLAVIEIMRKANIPVFQSLAKDKFGVQIIHAEKMKATHLLIMGKKEAMENSVVVRDMVTRAQETIIIDTLPEYLKKLK